MTASGKYKINVKESGIYLISPGTLKTFCLDSSTLPNLLGFKLQNFDPNPNVKTFDIPISYDPAGNIEFYGVGVNRNDYTAPNADYTETNVYWLVPATTTVFQMTTKSSVTGTSTLAPMSTFHLEQNNIWWDSMFGGTALGYDHWFWDKVPGNPSRQPYNFMINNYDSGFPDSLKFSAYLQSPASSSAHQIGSVLLNGVPSPSASWSGTDPFIYSTSMPPGVTNGVINEFQFQVTSSLDFVYFNWLEIEFPGKALNDSLIFHGNFSTTQAYSFSVNGFSQNTIELFDISDPKNPWKFDNTIRIVPNGTGYQLAFGDQLTLGNRDTYIALTPAQRKAPAGIVPVTSQDLTKIPGSYDYVMIAHESLNSGIQTLATYRSAQFMVIAVNIGDVYDSYSGGIFTPQAIKDFLEDVNTRWKATYVLLVGDASVDYKNYLGYGQENLVPTYLTDYFFGQTPSDFWFVPKLGTQNVPQMAIGRLPAKNLTELSVMVNKIKNYDIPPATPWNYNLSFVAADTFAFDSETLVATMATTPGISPSLAFHGYYFSTTSTSTSTTLYTSYSNTLNSYIVNSVLNNGSLITNYFGHGSVGLWANGSLGQLTGTFFQSSDLVNLANSAKLTFLVTLDCLNGYFAGYGEGQPIPNIQPVQYNPYSIAEMAVKSSGGAVASFSPTGQGFTTSHLALAQILYPLILTAKTALPPPPGNTSLGTLPPNSIGYEIRIAETNYLLANASNALETVSIFVLLGDPATQLWVP